jgi:hypothetical protein
LANGNIKDCRLGIDNWFYDDGCIIV